MATLKRNLQLRYTLVVNPNRPSGGTYSNVLDSKDTNQILAFINDVLEEAVTENRNGPPTPSLYM